MGRNKRPIIDNGIYFVTCSTHQRKTLFSNPKYAQVVIDQWKHYEVVIGFELHAYCVMSDHYHVLFDVGREKIISEIMHAVNSYIATVINKDLEKLGKIKIFQGRFWDEVIRSEDMYWQKVAYILLNPYREGLVRDPLEAFGYSNLKEWIQNEGEDFLLDLFSRYKRWSE